MWSKLLLTIALCLYVSVNGAIMHERGARAAGADPTKCYSNVEKIEIPVTVPFSVPGKCLQLVCTNSKMGYAIAHYTCGTARAEPPCKLTEDKSMPYPDCCPKVTCD